VRINILRQSEGGGGGIDGYIMDVYGTWVTVTWCPNFPLLSKSGKRNTVFSVM